MFDNAQSRRAAGRKIAEMGFVMCIVEVVHISKTARCAGARYPMKQLSGNTREFEDLFAKVAPPRRDSRDSPPVKRRRPLEMKVADALCRQLRHKQAPQEKRWIGHLICLNLLSMLKHRTR
jgi:hypothetical protein